MPQRPRGAKERHQDRDRAEDHQVPGAVPGEHLLQAEEEQRAQHRALDRAQAADQELFRAAYGASPRDYRAAHLALGR